MWSYLTHCSFKSFLLKSESYLKTKLSKLNCIKLLIFVLCFMTVSVASSLGSSPFTINSTHKRLLYMWYFNINLRESAWHI